jgi:glutamyl-tRNA reductase
MNDSVRKVISFLQEKEYSDDDIARLCEDMIMEAYDEFYMKAKSVMSQDDMHTIASLPEFAANAEISRIYTKVTGTDPQEEISKLVQKHADELIKDFSQSSDPSLS